MEDRAPTLALGLCFELGARVGDRHQALRGLALTQCLLQRSCKARLQDRRLQRATRLAGHQHQSLGEVQAALDARHLRRIGGIQHRQAREARRRTIGAGQNFGAQARTAHPEQQHIRQAFLTDALDKGAQSSHLGRTHSRRIQPLEPLGFVAIGPHTRIARPDARIALLLGPTLGRGRHRRAQSRRTHHTVTARQGRQQVRERIAKGLQALAQQLIGDRIQIDACGRYLLERALGPGHILGQGLGNRAVIHEGRDRRRRRGVHRLRAQQPIDIDRVRVLGVLGAGAGPQQTLGLRALAVQRFPTRALHHLGPMVVGQLGIRDRRRAQQARLARAIQLFVDRGINARHKEARHAGNALER